MVYRGVEIPQLGDVYLFSDYCGGWLRSFPLDSPKQPTSWPLDPPGNVVSCGVDGFGEVYVLTTDCLLKIVESVADLP